MGCVNIDDGGKTIRAHAVRAFVAANNRLPNADDEDTVKACTESLIENNPCLKDKGPDQCFINHLPGLFGRICLQDPDFEKCEVSQVAAQTPPTVNVYEIASSLVGELEDRIQRYEDQLRSERREIEKIEDKKEKEGAEEKNDNDFIKLCGLIVLVELFKTSPQLQALKDAKPSLPRADIVMALLKGETLLLDAEKTRLETAVKDRSEKLARLETYLKQLEAQPKNYPLEISNNRARIGQLKSEGSDLQKRKVALEEMVANEKYSAFRKEFNAVIEKIIARDSGWISAQIGKAEKILTEQNKRIKSTKDKTEKASLKAKVEPLEKEFFAIKEETEKLTTFAADKDVVEFRAGLKVFLPRFLTFLESLKGGF